MDRFQEVVKNTELPKHTRLEGYHEIKVNSEITKEQSANYWDSLFSEEKNEGNFDKDSLIAEIFGRNEDEFDFDFKIDRDIKSVLDKFSNDKWESLSDADRKEVISEFVSIISKKMNIEKIPDISFTDEKENICGAYNPQKNVVEINSNNLSNPKEVVDTVAHELRHAYQHQRALMPESHLDLLYKMNFENYISPIQLPDGKYLFFIDYQDQLVEAEARAFAKLFTGKEVSL